ALQVVRDAGVEAPRLLDPVREKFVEALDGDEKVRGPADLRGRPAERADWVDEVRRAVGRAAVRAIVAILILRLAVGARALHEAIRKEDPVARVEELLHLALDDHTGLAQRSPDFSAQLAVFFRMRAAVLVEPDLERREVAQVLRVHVRD